MKTNLKKTAAVFGLACALGASITAGAYGQAGGMSAPGSVDPAPAPSPAPAQGTTSGNSWTLTQNATWYGPGFWGEETACGMILQPTVIGVAHKKLPCGTQVTFSHEGRSIAATVIDRGPYTKGFKWDLTKKTAKKVGFLDEGSGPITATVTPTAP